MRRQGILQSRCSPPNPGQGVPVTMSVSEVGPRDSSETHFDGHKAMATRLEEDSGLRVG